MNRVSSINKSMQWGFDNGVIHPTIEDTFQKGNHVQMSGVKSLDCRTTSYFRLDALPEVKEAAKTMIDRYGAARCVTQMYFKLPVLAQLVQKLELIGGGPAMVASSITSGHFAVLPILVGSNFDNIIVLDRRVHNSVTLASQICQGNQSLRIEHNDMKELEQICKKNRSAPAIWYFCDGIYSMSGAGAPVEQIVALMRKYPNLCTYCDDAHGTLWYHNAGYFLGELETKCATSITEFGDRMVVALALGKCFASGGGGFIFSSSRIRDLSRNCGPTMTFNTVVNPAELGSALCIADMALEGRLDPLRQRLLSLIRFREKAMSQLPTVLSGFLVVTKSISPIAVIHFRHSPEVDAVLRTWNYAFDGLGYGLFGSIILKKLMARGYLMNMAGWPAVAARDAGLRFAIHSEMSEEEIQLMLETVEALALETAKEVAAGVHDQWYKDCCVRTALKVQPQAKTK